MNMITEHIDTKTKVSAFIDNSRTAITDENFKVAVVQISTNMLYKITLSATAHVRLALVVKRGDKPTLWDFYGGDRISTNATLLEIDFSATHLRKIEAINTATGIATIREDNGTMTVTVTGTIRSENHTTNLYIGLMPPMHDDLLCERCRARSDGPCGFCFATTKTSSKIEVNSISGYKADCLFWDDAKEQWDNIGCEVSV